jgi:hypothetical protein
LPFVSETVTNVLAVLCVSVVATITVLPTGTGVVSGVMEMELTLLLTAVPILTGALTASVNSTSACMLDCAPTAVTVKVAPSCRCWTIK